MFSQLLKLIPRTEFEALVKKTGAEYAAKGLSSWAQCVAMLFCQLGRAHSLREIEGGLKSCEGKLAHLGIAAPARSSLSYANAHRPWQLFEGVLYGLYEKVASTVAGGRRRKFRFKNKLVSQLDRHRSEHVDVRLDEVPTHHARGQAATGARSRRLLALLRRGHGRHRAFTTLPRFMRVTKNTPWAHQRPKIR